MLDRYSGKLLHIDFGDCFEASMHRDKFPERVPFRLTRMMVKAMEVSGIEGNFRSTCENVMRVLRLNKDSVMAMLEAFVHDPLINWRLLNAAEAAAEAALARESDAAAAAAQAGAAGGQAPGVAAAAVAGGADAGAAAGAAAAADGIKQQHQQQAAAASGQPGAPSAPPLPPAPQHTASDFADSPSAGGAAGGAAGVDGAANGAGDGEAGGGADGAAGAAAGGGAAGGGAAAAAAAGGRNLPSPPRREARERELREAARDHLLAGDASEVLNERAVAVMTRMSDKLMGRDYAVEGVPVPTESHSVPAQVQRLILQATSHENLAQSYVGWCAFW